MIEFLQLLRLPFFGDNFFKNLSKCFRVEKTGIVANMLELMAGRGSRRDILFLQFS